MGNKKKLINKGLIDLFPLGINMFVDLFAGSAVVSMNTKAKKYVVNDLDINLINLYNLFKTKDSSEIINHIESRINEYGMARERTKRNEYKDKEKIDEYTAVELDKELAYSLKQTNFSAFQKEEVKMIPKDNPLTGIEAILSKYKK